MPIDPTSLLPRDVGFDLRVTGQAVLLIAPQFTYLGRDGQPHQTAPGASLEQVAEELAAAGYLVFFGRTAGRQSIFCTPGDDDDPFTWFVRTEEMPFHARTLHEACRVVGADPDAITPACLEPEHGPPQVDPRPGA